MNLTRVRSLRFGLLLISYVIFSSGCRTETPSTADHQAQEIIVAAAANLTDSFPELAQEFTKQAGVKVVLSFGGTADLAKQIENGAPFDVFAAADVVHVASLEQKGLLTSGTVNRYARGSLVIWVPEGSKIRLEKIQDLTNKSIERVAIAKPDIAPYGQAAVEMLRALNVWKEVEPKVVYGMNVSQVKQFVGSGNAEVGFLPRSLIQDGRGKYLDVDEKLHQPINQALGVVRASTKQDAARQFTEFVLSAQGQSILQKHGYRPALSN